LAAGEGLGFWLAEKELKTVSVPVFAIFEK
jgi:hypothetical protein